MLVLPVTDISSFIDNEKEIYAKDSIYLKKYIGVDLAAITIDEAASRLPTKGTATYKVRSGDNLGSIARRYNVTVKQLMQWNGISDPRKLRAGQMIRVKR